MKKIKIVGFVFMIGGIGLIIYGLISLDKRQIDLNKDFMANTILTFDFEECDNNLCIEDFTINNKGKKGSKLRYTLVNTSTDSLEKGSYTIEFNNGIKINGTYDEMASAERKLVKQSVKTNLGEVITFKLKRKN